MRLGAKGAKPNEAHRMALGSGYKGEVHGESGHKNKEAHRIELGFRVEG